MPAHSELNAWLIPAKAHDEWLALATLLADLPDSKVPCRADPAPWWPEGKGGHSADTLAAIDACRRCRAQAACLEYALVVVP